MKKNQDWEQQYKATISELEQKEAEWSKIEAILRKAISHLSIVAHADTQLGTQISQLQKIPSQYQDQNLIQIATQLSAALSLISDFSAASSGQNVNIILRQVIAKLHLSHSTQKHLMNHFATTEAATQTALKALVKSINAEISSPPIATDNRLSVNQVLINLLKRLSALEEVGDQMTPLVSRLQQGIKDSQWNDILTQIASKISTRLEQLREEKTQAQVLLASITEQLQQVSSSIAENFEDHLNDHQSQQQLYDLMQKNMHVIHGGLGNTEDTKQLKTLVMQSLDVIRVGVDRFMSDTDTRHQVIQNRNNKLLKKIALMERETIQLQEELQRNRQKLRFDSLTGLGSRFAYDEQIDQELQRWQRYGTAFSYAIFDIDHFKKVNDSYGHNSGDHVLKIVAKKMLEKIRKTDLIFRIGGEEFALLLPNTPITKAEILANKLRQSISNSHIYCKQERVLLTLSCGLTETYQGDDCKSLYERADSVLYEAKKAGRNCQLTATVPAG